MRDQIKVGEESLIRRDSTLHTVGEGCLSVWGALVLKIDWILVTCYIMLPTLQTIQISTLP